MAGRVVDVTFRLIDQLTGPLQGIVGQLSDMQRNFRTAGRQIERTGAQIAGAGEALTKGLTVPIAGAAGAAVSMATDFEDAFAGVRKTVDADEEAFAAIRDGIMDMATRTASSKEEIAGVMEVAGQLGVEVGEAGENILGFTETMVMLGDATNLTAEEAAGALARFMNVTGDAQGDVSRLGSAIVALGNNFATDEASIVEMSTRLASAGTIAGLSSTDILALATSMSSVGINAEAGGTAMSQTLTQIAKAAELAGTSADENGKWAAKLETLGAVAGMTGEEFRQAWGEDAVGALQLFIGGLTDAEANGRSAAVIIDELGMSGIRQSNMLQSLALASGMMGDAVAMSGEAFEANAALADEAGQRYATTASQISQLKESATNLAVELGDMLLPYAQQGIDLAKDALDWLRSLDDVQKQNIVRAAGVAAAIGPATLAFGKMVSGVGGAVSSLGGFAGVLANLPGRASAAAGILKGIELVPPTGPVRLFVNLLGRMGGVIASLVARMGSLVTGTRAFGAVMGVIGQVGGHFRSLAVVMRGAFGVVGGFLTRIPLVGRIFTWLGTPLGAVGKYFGIVGKAVATFLGPFGRIAGAVGRLGQSMVAFLGPGGSVVALLAALVAGGVLVYKNWDKIKETGEKVWGYIQGVFGDLGVNAEWVQEQLSPIKERFDEIRDKLGDLWDVVQPTVSNIGELLEAVLVTGLGAWIGSAVGLIKSLLESAGKVIGDVMDVFSGLITFLTGAFSGDWSRAWQGIVDTFGGIFALIKDLVKAPINAVIGIINGAIAGINNLKIEIPEWVPGMGGQTFGIDIPTIPTLAVGTDDWRGGIAQISERGGEVVDLPQGSRVYPHDESVRMAYADGARQASAGVSVSIAKLADQIVVREDADIDRIASALAERIEKTAGNMGGVAAWR